MIVSMRVVVKFLVKIQVVVTKIKVEFVHGLHILS